MVEEGDDKGVIFVLVLFVASSLADEVDASEEEGVQYFVVVFYLARFKNSYVNSETETDVNGVNMF